MEATGAKIVLVSTWKEKWQKLAACKRLQDELANYLDKKFKEFGLDVYDKTPDNCEVSYISRGEGILFYLNSKCVEGYVILDDIQFDYDGCGLTDNFIKIDNNIGLTDNEVQKAVKLLYGN